jgi:serine/threonine protein kinase
MEERVIGRYRIIGKLSTGGMAEVYAARHELMHRYAAVKLLLPAMSARGDIVRRFFQEAQAAASIEHPGIVQVFDVGHTPGGRAYLVMEMLAGEPLSRRLQRQGALSLEATLILMRQLAGAIEAAHQRGIIHRDLKPDNLFLVPDPEMPQGERVKVLDFGLAKLLEVSSLATELTAQGAVFGTPSYMAPEQCLSAANVDGRADIYSIGCIFYTCLCGQPPFSGGGIAALMAHIGEQPVPPRQRAPAIPPAIDALILRLLEKDPDRRLPSCAALIAEIDHAVAITGIALDVPDRREGSDARDEATIRDDPTIKGTCAVLAELERSERPVTRGETCDDSGLTARAASASPMPSTRRLQARASGPRAETKRLSPSPGMAVPAVVCPQAPVPAPAEWPREPIGVPSLVPRPSAESESDARQAARGSTPTIDNGELETHLRRDGNRRLWWLGGAGLLGGLMAAGLVMGPDEESSAETEPTVLVVTEQRAKTDAMDTREEAQSPLPVIARPLTELDHLLEEAESAVSRRAWQEALRTLRAARQHQDLDARRLASVVELAQGVRAGQQHQAAFERLRAARGTQRLEKMEDAYAAIPEDSVYRAEARELYEAARHAWLEEMRQRAQRLREQGDCAALAGVVASVSRRVPEAQAEFQTQRAACVQAPERVAAENGTPGSSGGKILARVRAAQANGSPALALERCIDAWQVVARDEQLAVLCGVVACKVKNRQAARWHYNRTSRPRHRSMIAQTCLREGMDVQK